MIINVPEIKALLNLLNSPFSDAQWLIDPNGSGYIQVDFLRNENVWFSLIFRQIKRNNFDFCQFLAMSIKSLFHRIIEERDEELLESYLSDTEVSENIGLPFWFRGSLELEIIEQYAEQIQQQGLILQIVDK
ncbi:MAG: hypothetical protein JXA54_10330 [Candidatus Heimdallarchaeota archaeon]|nr:hypothetical protein [Candidatus Heimdallarchaeota archaeon]